MLSWALQSDDSPYLLLLDKAEFYAAVGFFTLNLLHYLLGMAWRPGKFFDYPKRFRVLIWVLVILMIVAPEVGRVFPSTKHVLRGVHSVALMAFFAITNLLSIIMRQWPLHPSSEVNQG